MEAKKSKMCKVRLRRLRPDMADKLKPKRAVTKNDMQRSSSSSETEEDDIKVDEDVEKISVKLKSPLTLGSNKDFDPYVLLTEAQAALKLCSDEKSNASLREENRERPQSEENVSKPEPSVAKANKKPKHCKKQKSHYYPPLEDCSGDERRSKLGSSIENNIYDLIYHHSDEEVSCNNTCTHGRFSSSASALAPTERRSSTGSSSSPSSEKCSVRFSKLFGNNCISVMDDENPPTALSKILSIREFDPLAPQQILAIIIKSIVSLAELSQRDDNIVCIDIDKRRILEFSAMSPEEKRNCPLNPYMDVSNIIVTHSDDEFLTFCLCEKCEKYREFVIHIMVEQFKATHMVVMLLDVLIKSYGPMLKNITAYNKFEKLLDSNKEIYWITCGVIYHKKAEHLDFIYDEYLSDNMIFVLFSSILMLNNPLLLLQVLAFHIECIVKAYAEGFLEIVEPDKSKIPADDMINYILNGYDDLMRISDQVASYLFAFENDFLRKFSLSWKLLCQRLYQQHVHLHLADTMLACIITLKEEELTSRHTDLIKRYIQFDDIMNYVEKRWTEVWIELNKFNLSDVERKRRKSLLDVYRIFDTVVQDAIGFSLQDSVDDNDFYDFRFLKNRRLAWKNIMSYTKMKWPDGFFQPPNTLVVDDKCATCNVSLEYHADFCKCITCSIAGGPLPPKKNADGKCSKCLAHEIVEKDVHFYDSKIMNVCANDDFQNLVAKSTSLGEKGINTALHDVGQELCSTIASFEELINVKDYDKYTGQIITNGNRYHISWAVFNHLNNRKRYPFTTIDEDYFCTECKLPSCLLARKILNNKISPSLSQDLVHYYQPVSMSREELRSILPNIMMYNRKLVASNNGLDLIDVHDLVVKIYWIFIISIYAIYFIDYDDEDDYNKEALVDDKVKNLENTNQIKNKSSILNALELSNNDIKLNAEKIVGNKDDTKFLEFLDKVKNLSPYNNDVESNFEVDVTSNNSVIQKKLNDILNIDNNHDIPSQCDNVPPPIIPPIEGEQPEGSESILSNTVEAQPKKSCKEKFKKCCLDHCDMDDHYKESHSSKKRLKKDCNHARMNETRDRLRKKLSQIVNARKNTNTAQTPPVPKTPTNLSANNSESNNPMEFVPNTEVFPNFLQQQKPPTWDEVHEIVYAFERFHNEAKRNENLQNLCECLQHLQTNSKSETKTCNNSGNKKVQHNHQKKMDQQQLLNDNKSPPQIVHSLEPPNKKLNFSDNSVTESAISNQTSKIKDSKPTTVSNPSTKSGNDLNFVSEICEIIDSYSKEQTKRSSNENLHNLCECLQQLQTNPKSDTKTHCKKGVKNVHHNNYQNQQKVQEQHQTDSNQHPAYQSCSSLEPPNKKSNLSNTSTRDASTSSQGTKSKDNNSTHTTTPISSSKTTNNLDFVSEICEIIDNYSKEQAKRRWIKETLSFIEGPATGTGKKKSQPQTLNPKKAAKKAKQKQRKEEEKRIAELQDLRAQFHNIYFKEFSEKLNLKSLKANKKRDKKKIADVESNIKNLQRAKAKVETAILELIATVKQTNSEFKFSYLPTKEQQLEKIRELEGHDVSKNTDKTIKVRNLLHHTAKDSSTVTPTMSSPFTMTPTNNLNMVPESYSMPYAHANHFPYNLGFPPPAAPPPFGLMRASPMCYAPPPAIAAAEEQRSLAPDVVAAMASNAATNNTTDPSKRIVTIRRVNLPNVPEPQVTVTAKGSSPDKDKLLYTFINGQLIQTGTVPPINIPQMPAISQLNNQQSQTRTLISETNSHTHVSKLAVENILTIPPPPPPKLSKTQMKKERKRLAKLQAESTEKAESNRIAKDQREHKSFESHQEQKQSKKKKNSMSSDQRVNLSCYQSSKDSLKKNNKNKLCNSNSTTSVSTNENNESPQLPQMLALKNSAKQKRSDSTTTSCSAVTSPSSNNSTSSQMNTRDNSLSSLKPVDSKMSKNKRSGDLIKQKCNTVSKGKTANKNKTKCTQQKPNKKQNRIPLSPSTTSSEAEYDDEEEMSENKENKLTSASMSQKEKIELSSHTTKLPAVNKQTSQSQKPKPIKKPVSPSTSDPDAEEEILQKNHKKRRPKLVDNGQFDNNPFKSLHMQDSDTNWSSEEEVENEEESENEIECKRKSVGEEKIVIQKSDHKNKQSDESKTTKQNQKNKKYKTQHLSTTPKTDNTKITNKTSKNNKNTNYQPQNNGCDHPIKMNNAKNQNRTHDGENRGNSQTRPQRQNLQQNCSSNGRNSKTEIGSQTKTNNKLQRNSSKQDTQNPASSNINNANSSISANTKSQARNNNRHSNNNNNNRNTNCIQKTTIEQSQHIFNHSSQQPLSNSNMENKNQPTKRSQRNKKYQLKSHKHSANMHHQSCSSPSGIPNHMGYFNINEVNIAPSHVQQSPISSNNNNSNQNSTYQSLAEQMQSLRLSGDPQNQSNAAAPSAQQRQQHINTSNVSIMDQLNRGVQVENLSLPPGITLTKVDPIKSEQLRQKSESIKKLAKPLQSQSHLSQSSQAFHHSSMAGPTIIAPPIVNSMAGYYGSPYVTATAGIDPQSGIIMVEANPPKNSNVNNKKATQSTGTCNSKQSKNKKRRNKSKAKNLTSCPTTNSGNKENLKQEVNIGNGQPKMITLRNPMFHTGPPTASTTMLQPQVILPGRPVDGFPIPTPLPVDQPAAIIKNENGMYTIRNPALHQAVTSGLAMGGYRQFGGNVSYYTPQEAAAEAARATRQQQQQRPEDNKSSTIGSTNSSSFSYFSNDVIQANMSHNNISISCTSIGGAEMNTQNKTSVNPVGGLSGDAAVIQRPTPQQRPISAIGSEIKNAQQQKQKTKAEQQQWTNFGSDTLPLNKNDNMKTSFLGAVADSASTAAVGSGDMNLQEKYQQSKYYNGFDVFTGSSGGSSSSATTCAHIHHNCGDDSPPPSITGYNSYLEGIPNTGVIRYDDASFLKNLIPGQNLNNEVSIHNVNESNFTRNAQSPTPHHVEITPVYGNRPSSANLYESSAGQTNEATYRGNYRGPLNDYNCVDPTIFSNNSMHMNLNDLETSMKYDFDSTASASVGTVVGDTSHNTIMDFKDLLIQNGPTGSVSHSSSPYLDESTLEGFVQNINSLKISNTSSEEPSSHLGSNNCARHGASATTSANPSNGWW